MATCDPVKVLPMVVVLRDRTDKDSLGIPRTDGRDTGTSNAFHTFSKLGQRPTVGQSHKAYA